MQPAPPRLFVADAPDARAAAVRVGSCALRPVLTADETRVVRRWMVVDLRTRREHLTVDRRAAKALARMISEPLNPRLLPVDWDAA